jgi:hypothetical protein
MTETVDEPLDSDIPERINTGLFCFESKNYGPYHFFVSL